MCNPLSIWASKLVKIENIGSCSKCSWEESSNYYWRLSSLVQKFFPCNRRFVHVLTIFPWVLFAKLSSLITPLSTRLTDLVRSCTYSSCKNLIFQFSVQSFIFHRISYLWKFFLPSQSYHFNRLNQIWAVLKSISFKPTVP